MAYANARGEAIPSSFPTPGGDLCYNGSMPLINFILHIDTYLAVLIADYGAYVYALLFLIIFLETGLVITPFLPGDSLLFAAGAIAASQGGLNIWLLLFMISAAAVIGDTLNYRIGSYIGAKAFENSESKLFKREYLEETENFYKKHGDKAVVLGRFFPIIRTFMPFVAGVGKMDYVRFAYYNIIGGILWSTIFLLGGFFFGNIQVVKDHFSSVILAIIAISFLPAVYHLMKSKKTP